MCIDYLYSDNSVFLMIYQQKLEEFSIFILFTLIGNNGLSDARGCKIEINFRNTAFTYNILLWNGKKRI